MKNIFTPLFIAAISTTIAHAQTPISSVNTSYYKASTGNTSYTTNGAASSTQTSQVFKYMYGTAAGFSSGTDLRLNSFKAGSNTYKYLNTGDVKVVMRRADNQWVKGKRELKFDEGTVADNKVKLRSAYNDNMESFFRGCDHFNSGTDNIFANDPINNADGNVNNIERVDVLFNDGYQPGNIGKTGFAVFERGEEGEHDPFCVALVLSVDADGNPASYSKIIRVNAANYGSTNPQGNMDFVISRRDVDSVSKLKMSRALSQGIGGVYFRFADFNVAQGTTVYGYSLLPDDFAGTQPAHAVDYKNTTYFPRTTNNETGTGGLDPISITGAVIDITTPLAVDLLSFNVRKDQTTATLDWTVGNAQDAKEYGIERSTDGRTWQLRGTMAAGAEQTGYTWTDAAPAAGINYYRVRIEEHNGTTVYSAVRQAAFGQTGSLKLYPNPAREAVQVLLPEAKGSIHVWLIDATGRTLRTAIFPGQQGMLSLQGLIPGIYSVRVNDEGGLQMSRQLSVQ